MCGTAWNKFCLPRNTNKYYIFRKPLDSTFDICNSGFCYCLLLANDLLCRNVYHDTAWQQLFFPLSLQHHFSFLLVDLWNCWQQSCLLIRLSANSYEKSRSVSSSLRGILSCTLCLLYNIQPFTFAMSTRCQKILIYHLLVFTDICYNAISISAKSTCPLLLL